LAKYYVEKRIKSKKKKEEEGGEGDGVDGG